uniref:LAGLIDADG endonuclease n=1 Tax=Saccharomycopsis fibuligera TaxID=4944 RepID=UPI002A822E7C
KLLIASNVIIMSIYLIYIFMNKYIMSKKCTLRKEVTNFHEAWPFKDSSIMEMMYGSLLGDAHAERRKESKGTRMTFYQEGSHDDYLLYLHSLIANLGFCNTNVPKITTRLSKNGKTRKMMRFSTWTYDQFNHMHSLWYSSNGRKRLPSNLDKYLSPLALSMWIMDDGGKMGSGLKLATNNFTLKEVEYLILLTKNMYNIDSTMHKTGSDNQYNVYMMSHSMPTLVNIVKPYIIPSMKYKFGKYM